MSSLDFIQPEECNAILAKAKSHSFKALPAALFLLDKNIEETSSLDIKASSMSPNVIMVRTLPSTVKMTISKEQQEKFRLSIANWCLANEGLRKSIQSLQAPPISLCLSSESLGSFCSGLQALDSGVADITEVEDADVTTENLEDNESGETSEDQGVEDDLGQDANEAIEMSEDQKMMEEVIDEIIANDEDDGLMNVNVKERRQVLMQVFNTQKLNMGDKATMSRMAAKNAAVVKMAVRNLNNLNLNVKEQEEPTNATTESILAMENKVKLMVSKFDQSKAI